MGYESLILLELGNGSNYLETQMQSHQYMLGGFMNLFFIWQRSTVRFSLRILLWWFGGRNDLGMMRYFPQVWQSDNTDAIARLPIQYGSSYLYPSISMQLMCQQYRIIRWGRTTPLGNTWSCSNDGKFGIWAWFDKFIRWRESWDC